MGWFRCVSYSDCYCFVNYSWNWTGDEQFCCLSGCPQWCTCCVPFWLMINKSCACFCCHGWNCQVVASKERLGRTTCFARSRSAFELQCRVGKVNETMCTVNDYTVVSHEMQTCNLSCNFFTTTKFSAEVLFPISNLSMAFSKGFNNCPFTTCFSNLWRSSFLKMSAGACCLILSISIEAIALTQGLDPTRASIVRIYRNSRGTYSSFSCRFRTTVEDSGWYKSFVCLFHSNFSSIWGVLILKVGILLSPFRVVVVCLFVSCMSLWQFLELLRNGTSPFAVWVS